MTSTPPSAGSPAAPDPALVLGVVAPLWWLAAVVGLLAVVIVAALGSRRDRRSAMARSAAPAMAPSPPVEPADVAVVTAGHDSAVPTTTASDPIDLRVGGPVEPPTVVSVSESDATRSRQHPSSVDSPDPRASTVHDRGTTGDPAGSAPASLGLWIDHEGRIVGGSGGRASFVGRHPDGLVGTVLADLVHGVERPRLADAVEAALRGRGVRAELELPVRTSSGWRGAHVVVTGLAPTGASPDATTGSQRPAAAGEGTEAAPLDAVALVEIAPVAGGEADCTGAGLAVVAELIADALADGDDDSLARRAVAAVRSAVAADTAELFRVGEDRLERRLGVGPGGVVLDRRITSLEGDTVASLCARTGHPVGVAAHDAAASTIGGSDAETDGEPRWTSLAVPVGSAESTDAILVASCLGDRRLGRDALLCLEATAGVLALASRRRGAEAVAFHRARHDELTGLVNRDVFVERLDAVLVGPDRDESIGVAIVDLDHFQLVNDSLGHGVGDDLLSAVGNRLHAALRPGDLLARFGGDEFVVMSRRLARPQDARLVGHRILSALAAPFDVGGEQVRVTASIGVAVSTARVESQAEPTGEATGRRTDVDGSVLVQQADAACSRAKQLGRERVEVFDPSMHDAAVTRLRTASELQRAIADGQLRVFYQPMVELSSGRVAALEALVRWAHPGRGLVAPGDFIPLSESTALIEDIGRWVVGEVADQLVAWREADTPLRAAINLSRRQLLEPRLLRVIDDALGARDLDPSLLMVELSEQALVAPDPGTQAAVDASLEEMAARGISITVDRFGTGAGSLPLLQRLPIEAVKLDRALVADIATSGTAFAVVSGLVTLARNLGKRVVATGVEAGAQLDLLRELHVDLAQGHLFSPAVHRFDGSQASGPATEAPRSPTAPATKGPTAASPAQAAVLLGLPEQPFG